MNRVVVDTNVIVSSFRGGKPRTILDLWRDRQFLLCLSEAMIEEYLRVIARFRETQEEALGFAAFLKSGTGVLRVHPEAEVHVVAADPDDDKFLACAVAAGADAIVSGDRHLLALGSFEGIPILDPAEFLDQWQSDREGSPT